MRRALCSVLVTLALGALGCEGSRSVAPDLRAAVASAEASAHRARELKLFQAQLEEANRRVENLTVMPIPEHQRLEIEALLRNLEREDLEKRAAGFVPPPPPPPRPCHCKPTDPLCDCL